MTFSQIEETIHLLGVVTSECQLGRAASQSPALTAQAVPAVADDYLVWSAGPQAISVATKIKNGPKMKMKKLWIIISQKA